MVTVAEASVVDELRAENEHLKSVIKYMYSRELKSMSEAYEQAKTTTIRSIKFKKVEREAQVNDWAVVTSSTTPLFEVGDAYPIVTNLYGMLQVVSRGQLINLNNSRFTYDVYTPLRGGE